MTERNTIARDLAFRLQGCTLEQLRAIDRVVHAFELAREEAHKIARTEWIGQPTVVSDEPTRIAMEDIDDDEPYADWDVSDIEGPCTHSLIGNRCERCDRVFGDGEGG